MVVVVAHAGLVAGRRSGGLDAPEQARGDEDRERVVHRLSGDRTDLGPDDLVDVVRGAVRTLRHRPENREALGRDPKTVLAEQRIGVNGCLPANGGLLGHGAQRIAEAGSSPDLAGYQFPGWASGRAALAECEIRAMRLGIADHFGWAVAVTASADHEVVDRRRIELIEPGMPVAPMHNESKRLDVAATAALVAQVRASVARATSAALDELADALPEPIVSISLRTWPLDFPDDIAVQRRVPYEARADAIMYRQVLAEAAHARELGRAPLSREGSRRSGDQHAVRSGRRDPAGPSGTVGAAVGEGPSGRARRDHRRRLKHAHLRRAESQVGYGASG